GVEMRRTVETLNELLRRVGREAPLALNVFTNAPRADGQIARQQRNTFFEQVDVRDIVADVEQPHHAGHCGWVIELERVVQRERFDVDRGRRQAGVGQNAHLRFNQLALRCDEQHVHLHAVRVGIKDLEIQLHRLHVERAVLLRFPPHQLARLLLLHTLDGDLLDDHVATADGGHDVLRRDTRVAQCGLNRIGDDARVHDVAVDDCIGKQWRNRDSSQLRLTPRMIDHRDFDQPRANIETDGLLVPTEQTHGEVPATRGALRNGTTAGKSNRKTMCPTGPYDPGQAVYRDCRHRLSHRTRPTRSQVTADYTSDRRHMS